MLLYAQTLKAFLRCLVITKFLQATYALFKLGAILVGRTLARHQIKADTASGSTQSIIQRDSSSFRPGSFRSQPSDN